MPEIQGVGRCGEEDEGAQLPLAGDDEKTTQRDVGGGIPQLLR